MPLVKVIGPMSNTSKEETVELKGFPEENPNPQPAPATSPPPTQPQEAEALEETSLSQTKTQFWRRPPRRCEDDDVPEEVQVVRSEHASFLLILHSHALAYFIFAVIQWTLLYCIEALVVLVKVYYYLTLIPFALGYIMLLFLLFFHNNLIKAKRKAIFYSYNAIMLQLSTVTIALPIATSIFSDLLFSSIISIIVITVSIVFASHRRDFYLHAPQYIIAWTFRFFIVASVGIITAISVQNPYFVAIVTMIMAFFMAMFILICGNTISRSEFIWMDNYGPHLYGSLFYLNYITIFSMCLLVFEELKQV